MRDDERGEDTHRHADACPTEFFALIEGDHREEQNSERSRYAKECKFDIAAGHGLASTSVVA